MATDHVQDASLPTSSVSDLATKLERLLSLVRSFKTCAVAFSGGVDSAVMAKAAHLALADGAVAVTGVSPSLAQGELETAREVAGIIGIRHEVIKTDEMSSDGYTSNAPDRCYHCKSELYTQMDGLAARLNVAVVINGANVDDLDDYRPGMIAAQEHQVRSPLAECELNKAEVRQLAHQWTLPVWDKPAAPCLSSRIAYGEEVTPERLQMIDQAERYLRNLGLKEVRVRYHRGDLARIEVPADEISHLMHDPTRLALVAHLQSLGFRFIALDLMGFQSGSLNRLVQLDA